MILHENLSVSVCVGCLIEGTHWLVPNRDVNQFQTNFLQKITSSNFVGAEAIKRQTIFHWKEKIILEYADLDWRLRGLALVITSLPSASWSIRTLCIGLELDGLQSCCVIVIVIQHKCSSRLTNTWGFVFSIYQEQAVIATVIGDTRGVVWC